MIIVFGVSKLNNVNIILDSDFFSFVEVPPRFVFIDKVFDNIFPGSFFTEVVDIDEHSQPSGITLTLGVGGKEIFSFNVETSIFANINQNIELVFTSRSEEVILRLVDKSNVSSVLVEGGVCSNDFIEPEIGELGQDIGVGISEGLV